MNIVFLSLAQVHGISGKGIYSDLMRMFRDQGHQVFIASPYERRLGKNTSREEKEGVTFLHVRTFNIQKTNLIEKGIGTILLEKQFKQAIKRNLKDVRFDLILYATPPITLANVVGYLKKKNPQAVSYLLLKDIFPQNAVDIGLFPEKSPLYWYFRRKEKQLYLNSDYIGCMSPANVAYVREHNPYYPTDHVEVAPNSIELLNTDLPDETDNIGHTDSTDNTDNVIREQYGLPTDIPIFIYGGNLGKPQGIDFLIQCLDANKDRTDCFFLIIGGGTDYHKLARWYQQHQDKNVRVMQGLPKEQYEMLVRSCDVGMIFLDHRFTIPNYPSRLLSYLEYKKPVLCATDVATDIGRIAEQNGYGYWCESRNPADFTALVDKMLNSDRVMMGEKGYQFLKQNYLVGYTYQAIIKHLDH